MSNDLTDSKERLMAWEFRKQPNGEIEVHDSTRLRSIIQKRPGPRGWVVHRIGTNGRSSGCDNFKTLADAKAFATNERIFGRG